MPPPKPLGVPHDRIIGLSMHGMHVDHGCDHWAAMAQDGRDGGERLAIGEHQAGTGVAQVVEADGRQASFPDKPVEDRGFLKSLPKPSVIATI